MPTAQTPSFTAAMKSVARDEFFRVIGPLNVSPRVVESTLAGRYYQSRWETPYREVVGHSVSDAHGAEATRFWLSQKAA